MYLKLLFAFLIGGGICAAAQVLIDRTRLTPARILVGIVCLGVLLGAAGWYEPLFSFCGCGVSLPLLGFGGNIAKGMREAIDERGAFGILTGAFTAASAGCASALVFGYLSALLFRGGRKRASRSSSFFRKRA